MVFSDTMEDSLVAWDKEEVKAHAGFGFYPTTVWNTLENMVQVIPLTSMNYKLLTFNYFWLTVLTSFLCLLLNLQTYLQYFESTFNPKV